MHHIEGTIFSGEFDQDANEFVLTSVKNIPTQSVLKASQLRAIYNHLVKTKESHGSYTMTVNDQLPVRLNETEVEQLLRELHDINKRIQ
ncbi:MULTISPECIES: hypothetical protein [Aneurinibacillus]|jgi:hypothetical protein|uniref:Uncharacterized protein n=1 Tax=Aneurinibacillus danicus TaxID=267746 RepID=A0A511V7J3_9BACL|nr:MULTISPECIES: hypothetical protein [Aneurinibacillus]GEN34924.1 hypothetical protein ADA01nite_23840 [Aneurinibacillus danicus]